MFFNRKKTKKKKREGNVQLSIDIGTHAVKTIVFRNQGRDTEILGYSNIQQPPNAMDKAFILNTEYVSDAVDKSIGTALASAKQNFAELVLPSDAIVGIAGELVTGIPVVVNIERDDENEEITVDELEHVIKNVKQHTFESTIDEIAEEILLQPNQIMEIDTYIDSIRIDGTKVSNPIGLRGAELTIKVYAAFAPKVQYDSVNKVMQTLSLDLKRLVVEPYAMAASYGGIRRDSEGMIFVDIGGGTTDVALIDGGEISGTKMYGIGGRVFTERIMREMGMEFEEAEKYKLDYCDGKIKGADESKMKEFIREDVSVWMSGMELSLEEFEDVDYFPSQILMCGGGSLMPEIMEAMLQFPWKQVFPFRTHPSIHYYYPNKVNGVIDATRSLQNPEDVTPIVLTRSGIDY